MKVSRDMLPVKRNDPKPGRREAVMTRDKKSGSLAGDTPLYEELSVDAKLQTETHLVVIVKWKS